MPKSLYGFKKKKEKKEGIDQIFLPRILVIQINKQRRLTDNELYLRSSSNNTIQSDSQVPAVVVFFFYNFTTYKQFRLLCDDALEGQHTIARALADYKEKKKEKKDGYTLPISGFGINRVHVFPIYI